jgi:hypothetical protein
LVIHSGIRVSELLLHSGFGIGPDYYNAGMNADLLAKRITDPLPPIIGKTLLGVTYWCLNHEACAISVLRPGFYLGGEIELIFDNARSVFISWDEKAGWADHFSLQVAQERIVSVDAVEAFDVASSPVWKAHMRRPLVSVSVLGWNDTPHILVLQFPLGRVVAGDGYEGEFGDGDDVVVKAGDDVSSVAALRQGQIIWRSAPSQAQPMK